MSDAVGPAPAPSDEDQSGPIDGPLRMYWRKINKSLRKRNLAGTIGHNQYREESDEEKPVEDDRVAVAAMERTAFRFAYGNLGSIDGELLDKVHEAAVADAKEAGKPAPPHPKLIEHLQRERSKVNDATMAMWQTSEVTPFLSKAAEDPDNAEVKREMLRLKKARKAYNQKEKGKYKNMFAKLSKMEAKENGGAANGAEPEPEAAAA